MYIYIYTYVFKAVVIICNNVLLEAYFLVILQVFPRKSCDFCLDQRIVKSNQPLNALKYPPKLSGTICGSMAFSRKGFIKPLKG